jgi:subtilisin family serine protease
MTQAPKKTVLDSELVSLVRRTSGPAAGLESIPLEGVAAASMADEPPAPAYPELLSLKVVVRPGSSDAAASWVRDHGGNVVSAAGTVLLAELPPAAVPELDGCDFVRRAEAPRRLLPRLDEARGPATGLQNALDALGGGGPTGDGVLVGIVDTGVDWRHPDFRDANGDTRLELFIHAHRPQGAQVSQFDEFDRDAINAALNGGGGVPLGDPQGHGTHCASIAVGNGLALNNRFAGVAPDAALVAMRSEPLFDTHTILGIRRTFEMAGGRPAVVTLSLGGHLGPHDGTSAIENVIARESGPGRIVVVAAGNEGGDDIHVRGEVRDDEELIVPVRISDSQLQFVDLWVPRGDDVDVVIETPDGAQFAPDGAQVNTVFGIFEAHWQEDPVNRDQNLTLLIAGGRLNHIWRIRIAGNRVFHGEVHAWGGTVNPSTSAHIFPGAGNDGFSVGMPGTEERAITVGSYVSRNRFDGADGPLVSNGLAVGQLSPFSSLGPSRYGALKPDVAAPGQFVTAALAAGSEMAAEARYLARHHPDGPYITIQGTSMATPFVAGVIALMLEREPELTPEEIQQRFRISCRRDEQTTRVWHPGFGFGKLDVEALFEL